MSTTAARSTTNATWSDLAEEFGERWNRFWFTPADPLPCAVLRIAVGLLAALHFVDLAGGLSWWYAADGLVPPDSVTRVLQLTSETGAAYRWTHLSRFAAGWELWTLHALVIAAALVFAAGAFSRISGALTLVALLAYVHRAPFVAGHVEPVLSFLLAYLVIAPAGDRLSLDRWLRLKRDPALPQPGASVAANVSLRLIQVHLAMFYVMMGLTKLYGDAWWDGNAMWILLAQAESRPLNLTGLRKLGQPGYFLINLWTHAVVYFELAFGVLIWNRYARPILLALSVVMWFSLIMATGHVLFGLTMLAAGLAFVAFQAR